MAAVRDIQTEGWNYEKGHFGFADYSSEKNDNDIWTKEFYFSTFPLDGRIVFSIWKIGESCFPGRSFGALQENLAGKKCLFFHHTVKN